MNNKMCNKIFRPLSLVLFSLTLALGSTTSAFAAATIVIANTVDAPGVGFNDTTPVAPVGGNAGTTLGQQRLIAFQAAADKWGATLTSNTTITIRAQWTALTCTSTTAVLGSAGSIQIFRDFAGAPFSATWYGGALGNKLFGADLNPAPATNNEEINANFNINLGNPGCLDGIPFYLGLDNNHGTAVDLVTVLTHEFGHGLGFQTFTNASTGAPNTGFFSIYDRFLIDLSSGKSWLQMTNAERATSSLNTHKLGWDGPQVTTDVPNVLAFGIPVLKVNSPAVIAGNYDVGTAAYGPLLTAGGVTGDLLLANDGTAPVTDGCEAFPGGFFTGKVAVIDRGTCTFKTKTLNAQNAGATAVVIVNNAAGSPAPGLGDDATIVTPITIPTVSVTQSDGTIIKTQLGLSTVNGTVQLDATVRSGADPFGKALVFTPNPFQSGSSVSHWDTIAFPNQLMEPNINGDLTHEVTPPSDLTFSELRDVGWVASVLPTAIAKTAGDNQTTPVNQTFAVPPAVTVSPAVSGITVTWTVNPTGAGATFPSTGSRFATSITDALGMAVAPALTANGQAGSYSLNATVPGAGTATFALINAPVSTGATSCAGGGGNWSSTATWSSGAVPTAGDIVTIPGGCTVTIDTAASAFSLTINNGGIVQYEPTTPRTLTTAVDVTIDSGGVFQTAASGAVTTHSLSVGGNLTNNGILDFSTNQSPISALDTAGADIIFTGAANNTFGGTGATTDIRTLTINKGTSSANILELNPTNFTVQGSIVDSTRMAFLTLTNGTLKVSGTFALTGRVFSAAAYTIPATGGFWLNNPNFVVAGQNGSATESGLLRVSQGTFNIGTASGDSMGFSAGSTIVVEGGAVNATGRFGVAAAGNAISYTQTGSPTITVCTVGNASATLGSFDLGTAAGTSVTMSGGTIVVQLLAAAIDYRYDAGTSIAGMTGGTLQMGNAGSGAAKAFNIRGVVPNLVINNASAGHSATLSTTLVSFNHVALSVTINVGNTFNIGNSIFFLLGDTVNNGTLTGAGLSRYYHQGAVAQTYSGTGVMTAPLSSFDVDNAAGVNITAVNQQVVARVILFTGGITGANKLTLGNGGVTTGVIQIGNTTTPTAAGTFDVAPTFNLGTGGEVISYLRTTLTRSTGPEINPTRTLTSMTYDDNDPTHALTITGGDLTLSSTGLALTMTNGRIITGANTLVLPSSTATVTRTNGYVDGNFRKTFTAPGAKIFEVGTANAYSPVTVNPPAGIPSAGTFTVKATQGPQPNVNPATSVQRYWTLTNGGLVAADLTFAYVGADVQGTEANYKVIRISGGTPVAFPNSTVNTATHTATLLGATAFSDWTVGQIGSPTASNSSIAGRITDPNGAPVAGTTVNLNGAQAATTITDSSGNYSFASVPTNGFYTVTPALANYTFAPVNRSFSLVANKADAVFTAVPNAVPTANAIDSNEYFVRQQYLDFLGREPDQGGLAFWTGKLNQCNGEVACLRIARIDVSAAFFQSEEFGDTGSYVYRLYQGSLGRQLSYSEFASDRMQVVGGPNLAASKAAFASTFVTRAEFRQKYQGNTTAASFVDALLQTLRDTAGVDLSSERTNLLSRYNGGATLNEGRALVLLAVGDNALLTSATRNPSFVLMEYFGYLRREAEPQGYAFWLNVLNTSDPQNYRGMVCSFLTSTEYQLRFGTVISRSNSECSDSP